MMSYRSEADRLLAMASDAERRARRLEAEARAARAHAETMTRLWSEAFDRERRERRAGSYVLDEQMERVQKEVESLLIASMRLALR